MTATAEPAAPRRAKVGDLELAYETFGSGRDPALLLIMGLASQMLAWSDEFCVALADRGRYVIRFDNRDIGLSTHLDHVPPPNPVKLMRGDASDARYRLEDMADDAAGLLTVLDIERAHVVGASMGGMIAQTFAIRHVQRTLSLTSIMSTPGPRVGASTPQAQAALMLPPPRNREDAGRRAVEIFRIIGSPGYPMDEERVADVGRRSFDRRSDPAGVMRQLAAIGASGDRTAALQRLTVPTLVIHGEQDPLVTVAGGRATAAAVPGSRLIVVPGMGHDLPRAVWPEIVNAIAALGND
jgi:pimeloyl-ACP methyl ester carboxylesterase